MGQPRDENQIAGYTRSDLNGALPDPGSTPGALKVAPILGATVVSISDIASIPFRMPLPIAVMLPVVRL